MKIESILRGVVRAIHTPTEHLKKIDLHIFDKDIKFQIKNSSYAVVLLFDGMPNVTHTELMTFCKMLFRACSNRRLAVVIHGTEDLNKYADDYLHLVNRQWQTSYSSTQESKEFTLEILSSPSTYRAPEYPYADNM